MNTDSAHSAERFFGLDLLRFIAASCVLAYHFAPRLGKHVDASSADWMSPFRFGYLGVELFFMISGFVIALSASGRTARSFLVHRAVRLYPTFWLALALTCTAAWLVDGSLPPVRDIMANATMLPGYLGSPLIDGVYWTLGVEWKFYVLIALAIALGFMREPRIMTYVWLTLVLGQFAGMKVPGLSSLTIFPYAPFFAFGLLLMQSRKRSLSWADGVWLLGATIAMSLSVQQTIGGFIEDPSKSDRVVAGLLMLLVAAMFAFVVRNPTAFQGQAWLAHLGALTYPLYLLHAGVGYRLLRGSESLLPPWTSVAVTILLLLLLVVLVTGLLERRVVPRLARSTFIAKLSGDHG